MLSLRQRPSKKWPTLEFLSLLRIIQYVIPWSHHCRLMFAKYFSLLHRFLVSKSLSYTCSVLEQSISTPSLCKTRLDCTVHKHCTIWNLCQQSTRTLHWKSPSHSRLYLSHHSSEFSQLLLLLTLDFISVAFMFTTIIFYCFHFNKHCFHVIFTFACVSFIFFSFCKCLFHIFLLS